MEDVEETCDQAVKISLNYYSTNIICDKYYIIIIIGNNNYITSSCF